MGQGPTAVGSEGGAGAKFFGACFFQSCPTRRLRLPESGTQTDDGRRGHNVSHGRRARLALLHELQQSHWTAGPASTPARCHPEVLSALVRPASLRFSAAALKGAQKRRSGEDAQRGLRPSPPRCSCHGQVLAPTRASTDGRPQDGRRTRLTESGSERKKKNLTGIRRMPGTRRVRSRREP